jgi:hypothetical protein
METNLKSRSSVAESEFSLKEQAKNFAFFLLFALFVCLVVWGVCVAWRMMGYAYIFLDQGFTGDAFDAGLRGFGMIFGGALLVFVVWMISQLVGWLVRDIVCSAYNKYRRRI